MKLSNKIWLFINICVLLLNIIMMVSLLSWNQGKFLECKNRGWTYLNMQYVTCHP